MARSIVRRFPAAFLVACVASALATAPARAAERNPVTRAAAALYEGIRSETLPNGLRVFLKPVPSSPVVTTMVAYKVGSADEDLTATGLAHYLEHLMFKGTDKIMPGDIDRLTLRNGGANNANTSEDMTVYHFDFAADRWEAALEVEADRMRHLRIDTRHEFEQEKGAVIEELERNEDAPWDLEGKLILPILFGKGPYGHPVIGERAQVRGATAATIKAYYDKWYHPNNAVLVVCGGFDQDRALARIKELFGPIPRTELPPRKEEVEVRHDRPVRKEMVSKFPVPRLLMGFPGVRATDADYYPLEVLQAVLAGGKTSRLYKKLVEGAEIAGEVGSSNNGGRYAGWFSIQVELVEGKELKDAEAKVLAELKRLHDEPIADHELKRVKQGVLASAIFERESVHNLADNIARGVTIADLDFLKSYLPRIDAVTAKDVQEVARKYLDPDRRVVIYSVPGVGNGSRRDGDRPPSRSPERQRRGNDPRPRPRNASPAGGGEFSLRDARRVVLDNGLTLLLLENHRLPLVVAQAFVHDVRLREPADQSGVASLVGRLLDEGTTKHTSQEIARLIEDVGGSLSLTGSGGGVKVLSPDRHLGLGLLFECLSDPTFPADAFAREKTRLLSEIEDSLQQPNTRAELAFRELVYGKHPYGRSRLGRRATVEPLSREDCARFHRDAFAPNETMVALVGDFDTNQVVREVTELTANWKKRPIPEARPPEVTPAKQFVQRIIPMPDANQLNFYLGQVGIRRDNPDYYKLLVMDYVLGTGPGFTDRLSARMRDRQGLAYTVQANITSSAGEEPGVFDCYIGTRPENFALVKKIFLEELNRIRAETPRHEEVRDAQQYLLGALPFLLTSSDQVAAQLLYAERFHLGFGYLEDYRKAVSAVTPEEVRAVARKYLHPERMVLVAAGAVDKEGRPLRNGGR